MRTLPLLRSAPDPQAERHSPPKPGADIALRRTPWGLTTAIILLGNLLAAVSFGASPSPVQTEFGLLQGVQEASVTVFRGVPYAAPPIGPLRWRPPQPPPAWEGVREADTFPPRCPQVGAYPPDSPPEPMSEDCLYLNIWVPAGMRAHALPVMVWIYGGALANGSASLPLYAGNRLAEHGVIVVTLNYRLGVLGFLAYPALSRESPQHVSGNYGLLDQIAALRWIHHNIAAFGGDPDRVTVFGQSAGSIILSALTVSPLTRGLFQRAIGESGGLFEPLALAPGYSLHGAEAEGADFARRAGAASLKVLRAMSPAALLKVPFTPHPVVDGIVLQESPYDAYARGAQHDLDILVGFNAAEGEIFLRDRRVTPETYTAVLSQDFPAPLVHLLAPPPGNDAATARARAAAFEGDLRFGWDMWTWARLAARTGKRHVYFYYFTRSPPFAHGSRYAGMGATHGMELPYVFGHLNPALAAWTLKDHQLSATMQAYWTNFARTGDPNQPGLPVWPRLRSKPGAVMRLGEEIRMVPMPDLETLRGIDRVYWAVRSIAAHPLASVSLTLGVLVALAAGLYFGLRRWRVRLRARTA